MPDAGLPVFDCRSPAEVWAYLQKQECGSSLPCVDVIASRVCRLQYPLPFKCFLLQTASFSCGVTLQIVCSGFCVSLRPGAQMGVVPGSCEDGFALPTIRQGSRVLYPAPSFVERSLWPSLQAVHPTPLLPVTTPASGLPSHIGW